MSEWWFCMEMKGVSLFWIAYAVRVGVDGQRVCVRSVAAVGRTLHGVDCGWGELACGPEKGKEGIHW